MWVTRIIDRTVRPLTACFLCVSIGRGVWTVGDLLRLHGGGELCLLRDARIRRIRIVPDVREAHLQRGEVRLISDP